MLAYLGYSQQIVRALVHRFVLKEPISEFTQDKDPSLEKGAEIDEYSKAITMAIVFSAFIISPMTDCLGSVLELNVSYPQKKKKSLNKSILGQK